MITTSENPRTALSCAAYVNFRGNSIFGSRFDKPTKSDEPRHIPILMQLKSLLLEMKLSRRSAYVFPTQDGSMMHSWDRLFEEDLHIILDAGGFPVENLANGKTKRYIVFHDLRHTFASHWVMNGGDIFKLQKILGHQSIQMTMRYAHLAPDAFAGDHERLAGISLPAFGKAKIIDAIFSSR